MVRLTKNSRNNDVTSRRYLTFSKKKYGIQKFRNCTRSDSEKRDIENKLFY